MRMTDGSNPWPKPFDQGFDPANSVDAAVLATRSAVFPHFGLVADPDPWF
jgi:acetoin utilization protein AcuC